MSGQDHHDSEGRTRRTSRIQGPWQLAEPPAHYTRGPYFVFLSSEFRASQVVLVVKNLPTNAGRYKKRGFTAKDQSTHTHERAQTHVHSAYAHE